jgi:eukaryotic-like serine/threonine-protein kinase
MSEVNWLQIEDIFSKALERPKSQREAYVKANCGENYPLCEEVLAMLRADDESIDLIEESIVAPDSLASFFADKGLVEPMSLALSGETFGDYKILEKIGGGGMGAVYLGENKRGKKVAVKFIKRGMDNNFNLRRFRYEQKILAAFDHPNITRFYDVGLTESGLPFLVMEYVEGLPIFDYCRRKNLSVREKLELFRVVFGAVEYAHYHKVIHRDLKPSNILVTNDGTVKLLDFGIAKILDPELIHESINPTATLFRPLTPDYASPEQVRGEAMTTTSDVYSLGIVLYELLTGEKPYKINQSSPYEIVRAVCEQIPRQPSEILKRNKTTFWNAQNLYPNDLEFYAEIDKVLLKALQKKVKNRYESVIDFDLDIEKILEGKPVTAEGKWQTGDKNQPSAFSLSSINSLAILPFEIITTDSQPPSNSDSGFLGIGLADILTTRLSNLQQLAVRPTSSVLRLASKGLEVEQLGHELKVDYLLEGHILRIDNTYRVNVKLLDITDHRVLWADKFDETESNLFRLQDSIAEKVVASLLPQITGDEQQFLNNQEAVGDAAFEAYLRGRFYWHTYTYEGILKSEAYFKQAIALDSEFSLAYSGLADCYNWLGVSEIKKPEESFLPAKKNALRALRLNRNSPEAYASLAFAIWAYDWDTKEAENLYRRALELNANYPRAHEWYAYLLSSENRHEEAVQAMERAEKLDPNSPSLTAMYGFLLYNARRHDEAYAKTKRSLELQPDYYLALQGLGWVCPPLEKYDEAIGGARKAVEISNLLAMNEWSLGMALAEAGDIKEAKKIAQNIEKRMLGEHIPPYYPAVLYSVLGEIGTAFKWLEKAVEERGYWTRWMLVEPRLDILRGDERYKKLAEKIYPQSTNSTDENFTTETKIFESKTKDTATIPRKNNFVKWLIPTFAAILAVLVVSLYFAIGNKSEPETLTVQTANTAAAKSGNTLVILPFTNENGGENILGIGLTDELRSNLGRFKKLSILAVNTSQNQQTKDVQTLGRETNADFVLRGNLQDFGNKIILSAELLNTKNGETMWREKFAASKAEFSLLRGQISERVLNVLSIELSSSEREYIAKPYTTDNEAFQLYLAGRYQLTSRKREGFEQAIKNFARAVGRDPNFALAYAGLADSYMLVNQYSEQQPPELLKKAEQYALKALALDENLAEAHTSLAQIKALSIRPYSKERSDEAESHFTRAIELNPSYATAHHWYGNYLFYRQRFGDALVQMQEATRLEPRSAMMTTSLATTYSKLKQFDKAIEYYDKAIELDKTHITAYSMKSLYQQMGGDYRGALQTFINARIYEDSAENQLTEQIMTVQLAAFEGKREEAEKGLSKLFQNKYFQKSAILRATEIAVIYDLLGDSEQAMNWLDKVKNPSIKVQIPDDLRLKNIRNNARFAKLTENVDFKA